MLMLMLIPMLMLMLMLFAASQWKEMSSHTHTAKHAIMSRVVVVVDTPLVVAVVVDAAPDVLSQRAPNNLYVLLQRFIIVLCG